MVSIRLAIGAVLTAAAVTACDLPPTTPLSPRPDPAPPSPIAAGCDLNLFGVVVERTSARTPVADAVVTWRHFEGGVFNPVLEFRSDKNGRYIACVPTPPSLCDSGACTVRYEVRATKAGYAADSTSVVADYNYWGINDFRVPDLQLATE